MKNKIIKSVSLVLLFPSLLLASEGEPHGIESLTWYYVNAGIFFVLMFFILKKPCIQYFANRRQSIKDRVDEANKVFDDAKLALENAKKKHEFLENELDKIRDGIILEAKEQAEHIVEMAEKKADYLKVTARQMIDAEEKKALKNLNTEFGKILINDAITGIKAGLDDELDKKLINRGVDKISEKSIVSKF